MLTQPAHAPAIHESLEIAAARGGDLADLVYARLFQKHPSTQAMFWRDSDGAIKGEMLARVFDAILDYTGDRLYGHRLIQTEAVNHQGFDVPPEMFASFLAIVADVVREACGSRWTVAMEEAWRSVLADLNDYAANPNR
jgi:hemoglobin-like flavoprotein